LFSVWQQTQLLDSKTMLDALRVNFKYIGHTTKNNNFRLVKLIADLSTRLYESDIIVFLVFRVVSGDKHFARCEDFVLFVCW